tara:strand:+ start:541 stop:1653 length:1113 start_codon:yes stop_codon:yes gene_type:complete
MAFKMNRPIIKGTTLHKASVAKAKKPAVAPYSPHAADVLSSVDEYAKSFVPHAIDFSLDMPTLDLPDKEKKTKKEKGERTKWKDSKLNPKNWFKKAIEKGKIKRASKKRIKELQEEYDREHPDGTLFPDGKYYDAKGREVKSKVTQKQTKKDIAEQYTVKPKDLVLKNGNWIPKKGAVSKLEDKAIWDGEQWVDNEVMNLSVQGLGRDKKSIITVDPIIMNQFGDRKMRNYNKEEKERLKTEGVFNEEVGRVVLPEEHNSETGEFISSDKETEVIIINEDVKNREKTKTAPSTKPKPSDFRDRKNPFGGTETRNDQYRKALKEWYKNNPSSKTDKSAMQKRDDRIWKFAQKGSAIHKNMRKSGYIPLDER